MQVLANVPLRSRSNGHAVAAGVPVPMCDLFDVAGRQS